MIISDAGALTVIEMIVFTDHSYPVLLAWCDSMSVVHWVTQACLKGQGMVWIAPFVLS